MNSKNDFNSLYVFLLFKPGLKYSEIKRYVRKLRLLDYLPEESEIVKNSNKNFNSNPTLYITKQSGIIKPYKSYYDSNKKGILRIIKTFIEKLDGVDSDEFVELKERINTDSFDNDVFVKNSKRSFKAIKNDSDSDKEKLHSYLLDIYKDDVTIYNIKQSLYYHIKDFRQKYDLRISDKVLENIYKRAHYDIKTLTEYNEGSHTPGLDMEVITSTISIKGYNMNENTLKKRMGKDGKIKIRKTRMASHRLTKANRSLPEIKKLLLKYENKYEYYFYTLNTTTDTGHLTRMFIIPKEFLTIKEFEWEASINKNGKHIGFKSINNIDDSVIESMSITFNQSDQLWLWLNFDMLSKFKILEFEIPYSEVGSNSFKYKFKPIPDGYDMLSIPQF